MEETWGFDEGYGAIWNSGTGNEKEFYSLMLGVTIKIQTLNEF